MTSRLALVLLALGLWTLAIGAKLYDVQVKRHGEFVEKAEEQQQRVVELHPPRGTIYDARGRALAVSAEVGSAFAEPIVLRDGERVRQIDPEPTAAVIAEVLGWGAKERRRLTELLAEDRRFVWVARKLDPPQARALEELDLDGIGFFEESKRYYPLRTLAAQVLGYVGTDNKGLGGLESAYDRAIASEPGRRTILQDARRGKVAYPGLDFESPRSGHDLHLTLDASVQHVAERELAAAVEKYNATRGSVILMDPQTGAILAMASYPTFDPNDFADYPQRLWRNLPVTDAYEPGSTLKMVTLAAALETNRVHPEDIVDCGRGKFEYGNILIRDHKVFDRLTLRDVIAKSSNVGAIRTGFAAGSERFYATLRAFGFGRRTGVDLPGESSGILRSVDDWSELSTAYISFGQEISVTPLQLTVAFAAIANGGRLVKPYVVRAVGETATHEQAPREVVGIPISRSSQREIVEILEAVVTEGTAKAAQIPGYRVAGKTGTAQKAIPGKGYSPTLHVASFVGFVPVEKPALVGIVVLDEPRPLYHGGEVAAPTFAAIVEQVLLYLGVEPSEERPGHWPLAPEKPPPQLAWETAPPPAPPPGTLPDLKGLSVRRAIARLDDLGLEPALHGHGRVMRQSPAPGTPAAEAGGRVELWLGWGVS